MTIPRLFMILPAYNEEEDLRPLLENIELVFDWLGHCGHERAYVAVDDRDHT